jgi:DNA-binding response OmpR family regulator
MAKGKILVVTADEALHREVTTALTGRGFEVHFIPDAQEAVGQSGWPFLASEVTAMVVDLAGITSAEAQGLLQIQKDKRSFALIFLQPSSQLLPERSAPLRDLAWPLPPEFAPAVRETPRPIVFLADRSLHLAGALPASLKEAGVDCLALDSPQKLPDFLLAQSGAGARRPGWLARLFGRKAPAGKPEPRHVAVVLFTGDWAQAESWDKKVRKTAPNAVCYRVTSEDPVPRAAEAVRNGTPVFLPREQPRLAAAVLEGVSSGPGDSSSSKIPVLLLDQDREVLSKLARPLLSAGYHVEMATEGQEALKLAGRRGAFHVAVLGMNFAYSFTYAKDAVAKLAAQLRASDPDLRLIFLMDVYPLERALREMSRALELGADDALLKPPDQARLLASVERASRRRTAAKTAGAPAPVAPAAPASSASDNVVADRYDLVFQVGEGGMGVVYMASDRKLGRKVAIKRMRHEIKLRPDQREKFIQEAKIISHLSHPYIVGVHEIVEDADDLYLVLDYVDGMPLSQLISTRGHLSFVESRNILGCLCQAIDYAHSKHILHRDLKPANIMIDNTGYVKVMDFGLAWEMKATISMLTQKEAAGTLAYMAPEQHLGQCGKPSDIYALGICLYEMLTGELPFKGPDYLSQKERLWCQPPHKIVADLPPALEYLMAGVLAPDPRQRIPTAAELYKAICSIQ